jgi:predicted adenine nucleotide alpha hydrolase (AANH) superfamily ATPase
MTEIVKLPPVLTPPLSGEPVLLHSCCAPCTGGIIETLLRSGIKFAVFFYNPNIHPRKEYELRKASAERFVRGKGLDFIEPGYDPQEWFGKVKGLGDLPERGERCSRCFDIRLELTAAFAHAHGFKTFTSSCGISRWKNIDQVMSAGIYAALSYDGLTYWDYNWRKKDGGVFMYEVARKEKFYRHEYCGCAYSLKKENMRRKAAGDVPVEFGKKTYGL